jgi:hypothetical protein
MMRPSRRVRYDRGLVSSDPQRTGRLSQAGSRSLLAENVTRIFNKEHAVANNVHHTVPYGTGLAEPVPRHFVPGYLH